MTTLMVGVGGGLAVVGSEVGRFFRQRRRHSNFSTSYPKVVCLQHFVAGSLLSRGAASVPPLCKCASCLNTSRRVANCCLASGPKLQRRPCPHLNGGHAGGGVSHTHVYRALTR